MMWLEPLQYEFMQKALLSSFVVGLICGLLSVFLLLKGWSLIGDALSHAVVPGVAVAYLFSLPFSLGAFTTALLASGSIFFLRRFKVLQQDAIIGFVFTLFFAAGLFIISLYPTAVNLQAVIFGNILAIDKVDLLQIIWIGLFIFLFIVLRWRDLMLCFFDEIQARINGIAVKRLLLIFFLLLSAAVVSALQAVGAILAIALFITPGACAMQLSKRFGVVLILAGSIGALSNLIGLYSSYFLNLNSGAFIVVLQTCLFLLIFLAKRFLLFFKLRGKKC